jgi:hypothetical protein
VDDAETKVDKTSSSLKINHGDCTTSYGFANDKLSFAGKGRAYSEDGWKIDLTGAAEIKQAKNEWKLTKTVDVSGEVGGIKTGTTVSALVYL